MLKLSTVCNSNSVCAFTHRTAGLRLSSMLQALELKNLLTLLAQENFSLGKARSYNGGSGPAGLTSTWSSLSQHEQTAKKDPPPSILHTPVMTRSPRVLKNKTHLCTLATWWGNRSRWMQSCWINQILSVSSQNFAKAGPQCVPSAYYRSPSSTIKLKRYHTTIYTSLSCLLLLMVIFTYLYRKVRDIWTVLWR